MKLYLFYTAFILVSIYSLKSNAQLSEEQQLIVKEKTNHYCLLLKKLANDPKDALALEKIVNLFGDATNNLVYNDLIPGQKRQPFMEYITMLRNYGGTLSFSYGTPRYFYTEQYGTFYGIAQVSKTIIGGFEGSRTVSNVIVVNLTTQKLGDIGVNLPKDAVEMEEKIIVENTKVNTTAQEEKIIHTSTSQNKNISSNKTYFRDPFLKRWNERREINFGYKSGLKYSPYGFGLIIPTSNKLYPAINRLGLGLDIMSDLDSNLIFSGNIYYPINRTRHNIMGTFDYYIIKDVDKNSINFRHFGAHYGYTVPTRTHNHTFHFGVGLLQNQMIDTSEPKDHPSFSLGFRTTNELYILIINYAYLSSFTNIFKSEFSINLTDKISLQAGYQIIGDYDDIFVGIKYRFRL